MPDDKKDSKSKKRAAFSAPTPPSPPAHSLVTNQDGQKNDEKFVEEVVAGDNSSKTPSPTDSVLPPSGKKVVSKSKTPDSSSSLSSVLHEDTPTAQPKNTHQAASSPPSPTKKSNSSSPNAVLVGITVFSIVLAISGWALYFSTNSNLNLPAFPSGGDDAQESTQVEPAPTQPPTPTLYPKADITVEILNGSGTAGAAGQVGDKLEELGYAVVKVGNADSQDYETTEIYFIADFEGQDTLMTDLETEFGSASVSGTLEDSDTAAQIILGQDWFPLE